MGMNNLLADANGYISRQPKPFLIISGLIFVLLVGFVDYATGSELNVSIFYLIPISLSVFFLNRKAGVFLSIASAVVSLAADLMAGHNYSHPMIIYWNSAVQLGFFLIIVFILSALKIEYEKAVNLNADLQDTLVELKRTEDELERKAQDLACSNAELERFAYVAAHDLKQPLIVAGGYMNRLGRLYRDKLDPNAERFIGYASDAMSRMEALIDALLAYARAGAKANELKVTNCNEVIGLAVTDLQAEIEKSGAIVTHDPLPIVLADDIQIGQLFQNLISNGIKFHKERPPRVHVSAKRKENEWVFCFCDNGIGIDPKDINGVFDIFQRLHSSSEYQGSGIGLATCKKIVECYGGRIWAESEPGKGSKFCFTIPIKHETPI